MNSPMRPPLSSIVPESAPFTAEQRVWLNGFFAGLLDGDATALSPQEASALMPGVQVGAPDEDDGAPWHDQTMPLAERMKLAEGRPLPRKMMAAMGQQDCGQCGYDCKDYANALFSKKEERLNLCVPGGKETARMLKALHAEIGSALAPAAKAPDAAATTAEKPQLPAGTSRDNPVEATFISRALLNKKGSAKETWHIEFDLTECRLDYQVGDAFGLYPRNDPALADAVLKALTTYQMSYRAAARYPKRERLPLIGRACTPLSAFPCWGAPGSSGSWSSSAARSASPTRICWGC